LLESHSGGSISSVARLLLHLRHSAPYFGSNGS
jgi:hypothetical protein